MGSKEDKAFFYNYSIVIGLLAVMIIIFLVLALYLGVDEDAVARKQATKVSANTVPVGVVNVLDETAEGVEVATVATVATSEAPEDMGLRVYNGPLHQLSQRLAEHSQGGRQGCVGKPHCPGHGIAL